jgi:hypothetical protein
VANRFTDVVLRGIKPPTSGQRDYFETLDKGKRMLCLAARIEAIVNPSPPTDNVVPSPPTANVVNLRR